MDFVFLCPPSNRQKSFEKKIGLAYIQAFLKSKNIESVQYIPKSKKLDEIIDEICGLNGKIIGISCYDANYYYVKLISKKLKKKNNDIIITVGGPTATFSSETILNDCPYIDYCILGYGEIVNYNLFSAIKSGGSVAQIKGIAYRVGGGVYKNALQELPSNLDDLPSPYLSNVGYDSDRKLVFTSRGCVYKCVYCNCSIMSNNRIYYFSVDRIIDELDYINANYPNSYVQFGDDAFTLNIERAKKICKIIIEKKYSLKFFCETRVDRLDDELLKLLKHAGFVKVDFGLESASCRVLNQIKKVRANNFNGENDCYKLEKEFLTKMSANIKKCKNMNLDPMVNIITGLPTETLDEAKQTIKFISNLKLNSYSHNYLRFYSGTELYGNYEKFGYKLRRSAFTFPCEVEYPYDVTKIKPLKNSVIRNEIVRLKERIKIALKDDNVFHLADFENISTINELRGIDINQELFIFIENESDKYKIIEAIVANGVPTNNLVFIINYKYEMKCYSILDKENAIKVYKLNEKFRTAKRYFEFGLVEVLDENLLAKFDKYKIDYYKNRTILLKNDKQSDNIIDIAIDYCDTYKGGNYKEVLLGVLQKVDCDLSNNLIVKIKKLQASGDIEKSELRILKNFMHYYLMGEIV